MASILNMFLNDLKFLTRIRFFQLYPYKQRISITNELTVILCIEYTYSTIHQSFSQNWFCCLSKVRCVFLQWIPWVLRMGRPGEKITRKTIMMQNKMKELDLKERSSKSLLANVLDMDDDFRLVNLLVHK